MPRTGLTLTAFALVAGLAGAALAQGDRVPIDARLDGRTLAGLLVDAPLQPHDVTLEASQVVAWDEDATRRLLLDRDVEIAIGPYRFRAARAAVWIEKIELPDEIGGGEATQLAIYFDRVRTPGAAPAVSQSADRLLVTALVSGDLRVRADVFDRGRPFGPFLGDAEYRLSQRLAQLIESDPDFVASTFDRGGWRPPPGYRLDLIETPEKTGLEAAEPTAPYIPERAVVTFSGPDRVLVTGEQENALVISGGVAVQYQNIAANERLHLSADSAVVFLKGRDIEKLDGFQPEEILGVYLEGGVVATDGEYTMRGPRMYYDLEANTGVVLDAVFWAYDERRELPLYLRADIIRQEADDRWEARDARFANVEFFEPHFAIGATSVALTRKARPDGSVAFSVDADGVKYLVNGRPTVPLPAFKGEVEGSRAPRLSFRTRNGDPIVYSRWDLFGVLGQEPPPGVSVDLLADYYFNRGPATGVEARWATLENNGEFFAYYFRDDGEDQLGSGAEIERNDADRGTILAENRWRLSSEWTLFSELATVSDPAFFDALFEEVADTRRELRTGAVLRRLRDDELLAIELSGSLDDFTPNEYLLQSRGYQVERLPEVRYDTIDAQLGETELFGGAITHFSETRAGVVRARFTEEEAEQYGLDTPLLAQRGLGLNPNQSPGDVLDAAGFPEREVARFDTRHEFSAPIREGAWTLTPRAVARFTAWDDDFEDFSPNETDDARFWGALGADLTTSFVRLDDQISSDFWDLNRLRHVVEPRLSLWWADTTIQSEDLPTYDEGVEGIAEGAVLTLGVKNTWQTKRGGVGALRSVDWITLDVNYVSSSGDSPEPARLGRVFDGRPELASRGELIEADGVMWLTDAVALTGAGVYDLDEDSGTYASAGFFVDHGVGFSTFADLRYIDPLDSTLLHAGASYRLTSKYALEAHALYDLEDEEFQATSASISRRFPQWTVRVGLSYDDLRDDTSVSVVLRPVGLGSPDEQRLVIFPEEREFRAPESAPLAAPRRFGG